MDIFGILTGDKREETVFYSVLGRGGSCIGISIYPKAADRGEDKPIKQHDHAMDAVRYFCYTILNNKTIKIRSKSAFGLN
ncbi:hypothetical protein [Lacrimispora sp.]|uniref:hypothetical protein n=1 Tax=Lacrimispora sp. TaxID=2719234 RepID=UPI0032E4681F